LGYRLFYTGAASSAQGIIVANDFTWSLDSQVSNNTLALTQSTAKTDGTALAADTIAANSGPMATVGVPTMATSLYQTNQVVVRPENGLRGILKYQKPADAHSFVPWLESGTEVCVINEGSAEIPIGVRNSSVSATAGGIEWNLLDPSLMGAYIQITGAGSYRLEIAICYEQDLSPNNAMIDMARQSPMINRLVLETDDVLNSTVHPAPLSGAIVSMMGNMSLGQGRPKRRNRRRGRQNTQNAKQQPQRRRRRRRGAKKSGGQARNNVANVQIRVV
jgi:hypothetical protein